MAARAATRSRLLSTLAVLEQRDGQLNPGSLSAITAAKVLGGAVHGFIAGASVSGAAQDAAKVDGVEKIITVDNAAYEKVCRAYARVWVNIV
jgi:electron transfer flavoprotein alpha subunit